MNKRLNPLIVIALVITIVTASHNAYAYDRDAVSLYNKGIDLSIKGNYPEAIDYFNQALALDPTFTDAYYNLGRLYEVTGEDKKALEAFEILLKNNPNDEEAAYKIASLYYKKGEYSKAFIYLNLISPLSPKYKESQALFKKIEQKIIESKGLKLAQNENKPPARTTMTNFNGPTGIAKDSKGNLYIANYSSNSLVCVKPDGTRKNILIGKPLSGPIGVVVDKSNNIYVANYLANNVVKINTLGQPSVLLQNISKPYYLYLDESGYLYISEQGKNSIIKLKLI